MKLLRPCPTCGRPLTLVTTIPRVGDRPEIRVLKCIECERRDIDLLERDAGTGGDKKDGPCPFATSLSVTRRTQDGVWANRRRTRS